MVVLYSKKNMLSHITQPRTIEQRFLQQHVMVIGCKSNVSPNHICAYVKYIKEDTGIEQCIDQNISQNKSFYLS